MTSDSTTSAPTPAPSPSGAPRRFGWGIVSTGHIASVFARDLAILPDEAALVGVSSRSADKAADFADTYGFTHGYGSVEELAANPDVDVVYVASTHNDHLPAARACLEAGKAVLVEKPLTVSAAETDELLGIAADRGVFLMEALWSRTNPLLRRGAEIARSGELGAIRHLSVSFGFAFDGDETHRLLDPEQAGGAVLDLGVYPAHMAQLFLGEPDDIRGWGYRASTGVDGHLAATLSYEATADRPAATAHLLCSLDINVPPRLEVFGEKGSLTYPNFLLPPKLEVRHGAADSEPDVLVTQWPGGGYTFQAQEVMRCLRAGVTESPLVPWADTRAVARTLDRWGALVP